MGKRKEQSETRRQQILECGLDMIVNRGYEATRIRDIAERLGISLGLFFNYFETKEKLYEELVRIGLSGPEHVFGMIEPGRTPLDILKAMTDTIFTSIREDSLTAKLFLLMAQALRSDANPESINRLLGSFDSLTPTTALIREGQRLGEIRHGDPVALTVAFWGTIQGIAGYVAVCPGLPLPESDWVIDILKKQA